MLSLNPHMETSWPPGGTLYVGESWEFRGTKYMVTYGISGIKD